MKMEEIRLMTYNIRYDNSLDGENAWDNRKDFVVELIKKYNADVLLLQEALSNQMDDLSCALPEYSWVGAGRDDGKKRGEFCPIFYRRDKLELLEEGVFWLSETPHVPGSFSWGAAATSLCEWCSLRPIRGPSRDCNRFFVFNTHLDYFSANAKNCREVCEAHPSGPKETFVGSVKEIAREIDFVFFWSPSHCPVKIIQHIHATEGQNKSGDFPSNIPSGIQRPGPSDHFPVIVDAAFPPSQDFAELMECSMSFTINYLPKPTEELRVAGSLPKLGGWKVAQAPVMTHLHKDRWSLEIPILKKEIPFEYKYVIVDRKTDIGMWELKNNREVSELTTVRADAWQDMS